jgi:hypothetical protein
VEGQESHIHLGRPQRVFQPGTRQDPSDSSPSRLQRGADRFPRLDGDFPLFPPPTHDHTDMLNHGGQHSRMGASRKPLVLIRLGCARRGPSATRPAGSETRPLERFQVDPSVARRQRPKRGWRPRSAQRRRARRHVEQRKRRGRPPQREDRPSQQIGST